MQHVWSAYYDDNPEQSSRPTSITSSSPQHFDSAQNDVYQPANYSTTQTPLSSSNLLTPEHLLPPRPPFAHPLSRTQSAQKSLRSLSDSTSLNPPSSFNPQGREIDKDVSLSINYFPLKFSSPRNTGIYNRKRKGVDDAFELELNPQLGIPKRGGGRSAFKQGEARMAGAGDEGDDDEDTTETPDHTVADNRRTTKMFSSKNGASHLKRSLRWNRFKWCLFIANTVLTLYALAALVACLLTWFNIFPKADVIRVANRLELIVSTVAASFAVLTSLLGWSGILLNSRPFLAVYVLFIWISFMFLITPGYITYKRREFNLEGKLDLQWSRGIGVVGRLRIQNELLCCGYFSPFVEATVSQSCYSRSTLPGCKAPFLGFQRMILERWYEVVFLLVPVNLVIFVVALLCSNHITYRFGKGMMPKAYRLEWKSVAMILDNYASQLADIYGEDAVRETRKKIDMDSKYNSISSPSDTLPKTPYGNGSISSPTTLPILPYNAASSTYTSSHVYNGSGMIQRKHVASHDEQQPQDWDITQGPNHVYDSASAPGSNDALIHAGSTVGPSRPPRNELRLGKRPDPPTYENREDGKF
ncbi:hypothetical protein Clacol_008588 [Clathrus columnatus]|uniref:Tetraspanin n=1 Tax=Clathrus columnatus TaxID=1419009 RepID=A0AAV5AI93_9AGAM|nr:hypothetical protein Clacol_008588 [Clathrus columnatus]